MFRFPAALAIRCEPALKEPPRFLTLGVLAFTLAVVYGIWYSYSVLMVALLREFGWSRSVLAGAFSVFTLMHGVANPLIGWLCGRLQPPRLVLGGGVLLSAALFADSFVTQPWHLYLAFGVCTALGVATSGWVPALVQAQRRFPDRLGLALGIVSAGVGVGMLLVVPLCQLLIDAFGWRMAFRWLALLCLVWIIPSAIYLMRTTPPVTVLPARARAGTEPDPAGKGAASATGSASNDAIDLRGAMRMAPFWLIIAASMLGNICAQTLHVHQVVYLVDHGVAAIVAATVVSVVGGSSIIAKILGGWISDMIDRELVYIGGIVIMLASVFALLAVGASPSHWGSYVYAVLLGIGYSATASVMPAMTSDRFSGPHFGAIVGVGLMASAAGSALGPWFAGWLFDRSGSYNLPLALIVVCGMLAGGAGWKLRRLRLQALGQKSSGR